MIPQIEVDEQVNVPANRNVFLEFDGLVCDTSVILENELEVEPRTSLDKFDKYFCRTISSPLRDYDKPYLPFK